MQRTTWLILVVLLAASSALLMGMGASHNSGKVASGTKAAVEKARANSIPVLVDVGSTHCIPCRKMAPTLDALKKKYEGRMEVVFVDTDKERAHALELGVTVIPTQILYDKSGREFTRHVGLLTMEEAESLINKMGL